MRGVDPEQLNRISLNFGDAALDPSLWPEVMETICRATSSTGAMLFQSDVRTPDMPVTEGVREAISNYFANGWHIRDLRSRGVPMLLAGAPVVTDQEFTTPEEMRSHPYYNDILLPYNFFWFAGIATWAGSALWLLCLQRTPHEGPFEPDDKRVLAELSPRLTEAATLSTAVGRSVITGITNALESVRRPAIVLDRFGFVLNANAAAEAMFNEDVRVRSRRLVVRDQQARAVIETLIDRLRSTPNEPGCPPATILARRRGERPVLIRAMPIPPTARGPFLGARALLTFTVLEPAPAPDPDIIAQALGLTRAEARLASLIAGGAAPAEAARRLGVARETARNQLKAIFAKTETHRQGELVALLARLGA